MYICVCNRIKETDEDQSLVGSRCGVCLRTIYDRMKLREEVSDAGANPASSTNKIYGAD